MTTRRRSHLTHTGYLRLAATLMILGGMACTRPAARTEDQRPFSIIMLPDTQIYSQKRPDLFFAQTNWIKQNRDQENIVFVTHVGDLVQNRSQRPSEWKVADEALAVLDGVVPYGIAIGNHDYDSGDGLKKGIATMYLEHFHPDRRFKGRPWYGGASPNGLNSCQLFSGGGIDFVIIHLEMAAPDDALAWAKGVLERYPARPAILVVHDYLLGLDGVGRDPRREYRPDGNSGEQIWNKLVCSSPQIFMVLCGHVGRADEYHQISTNQAGGPVLEMLVDYQRRENGGNAFLRIIRFVPAGREIQFRTYSPALDQFETDSNSQFTVPWELPELMTGRPTAASRSSSVLKLANS